MFAVLKIPSWPCMAYYNPERTVVGRVIRRISLVLYPFPNRANTKASASCSGTFILELWRPSGTEIPYPLGIYCASAEPSSWWKSSFSLLQLVHLLLFAQKTVCMPNAYQDVKEHILPLFLAHRLLLFSLHKCKSLRISLYFTCYLVRLFVDRLLNSLQFIMNKTGRLRYSLTSAKQTELCIMNPRPFF